MAHVSKPMAASAPALAIPIDRGEAKREDRELVRLSQDGTPAAFEELVRRHQQRVFALVERNPAVSGGRGGRGAAGVPEGIPWDQEIRSTGGVFHVALQNCRERVLGLFEEEKSAAIGL